MPCRSCGKATVCRSDGQADRLAQANQSRARFRSSDSGNSKTSDWSLPASRKRLQIPFTPPSDYQLTLEGDRTTGLDLGAGLVVDGRQVLLVFNGFGGTVSGFHLADGRSVADNVTTVRIAKPLADNQPFSIVCTVHPNSVVASVNGRDLIAWHGNAVQLSMADDWEVPDHSRLFLATFNSRDQFRRVTLQPLPGSARSVARHAAAQPEKTAASRTNLQPVPAAEDQQAAAKVVKEVYGTGIDKAGGTAEKCRAIEKLLADAATEPDMATRFAMIETAGEMAAATPSVPLVIRAIKQLGDQYDVNTSKLLADAFAELGKSKLPKSGWGELADAAATAADEAQYQSRPSEAKHLATIALRRCQERA